MRTVAVIDGFRTPFCKEGTDLADCDADVLGGYVVREMQKRLFTWNVPVSIIDRVVGANVATPLHAPNVARVVARRGGLPMSIPADTIGKNCGSGLAALNDACLWIASGNASTVLVVGMESMSRIPMAYPHDMAQIFMALGKEKNKLYAFSHMLALYRRLIPFWKRENQPLVGVKLGLTDPLCDLIMGLTAENLARDASFDISRALQDEYSYFSHRRASRAEKAGYFAEEIIPLYVPKGKSYICVRNDNGIRHNATREDFTKLQPFFDRRHGTVTVGNSSQITDGAAAMLLMDAERARAEGLPILGYLGHYADIGFDPSRMGLSPAGAIAKLLKTTKRALKDFRFVELNEAFAAIVHANWQALDSASLMQKWFGDYGFTERIGCIPDDELNPDGGAIALGHPVGASGIRLALTALKRLRRIGGGSALVSLCVGGGQGVAMTVESEVSHV